MASTSASRSTGATGRIQTAASTLYSDNQSLIAEFRKALNMMKEIGVDLERDNQSQMVKELENAAVELLATYEDCTHFSSAIHSVGELTNFKKLFEDEIAKLKASSSSVPQNHPIIRQFREAIWAAEMVDENTICVAAILGSTLTGEFENVKLLINELLVKKNKETGWDTPIHVDAASGGFIAPFLHPELEWDFHLPLVKIINVSGHKYGLV